MKAKQDNRNDGFTLVELMISIVGLVVLALLLLPAHHKPVSAKRITCTNSLRQIGLCYRQWAIDNGDRFPMAVSVTNGGALEAVASGNLTLVFQVMSNELNTPKILFCPTDQRRVPATTFANLTVKGAVPFQGNANLSYFVGLDAEFDAPQMFLSGDDNLLVGGPNRGDGVASQGTPVQPGILPLWTNTPAAWSDKRHGKSGNVGLADGSVQGFSSSKLADALRNTGAATNRLAVP